MLNLEHERRKKMLNQVVLVGRLTRDPVINKTDNNKQYSHVTLAVPRSFKNINGEYETDFIDCILWENVAKSTVEYCHKGDVVGIKGRIQSRLVDLEDGSKKYYLDVVAERTTFLSNNKETKFA